MEELAADGYKPTQDDILKVRDPTRTIETLDFQYGKAKFRCAGAHSRHLWHTLVRWCLLCSTAPCVWRPAQRD